MWKKIRNQRQIKYIRIMIIGHNKLLKMQLLKNAGVLVNIFNSFSI